MIGDIYIQTTEETRMIDTKKEQERDDTVLSGRLRMNCVEL